jgi:hypothetical protein
VLGKTATPRVQDLVVEDRAGKWFVLFSAAVWCGAGALAIGYPFAFRLSAATMLLATVGIAIHLLRTRRLANVAPTLRIPKGVQPPRLFACRAQHP